MHIAIVFVISMCILAAFHPVHKNPKNQIDFDIGVCDSVVIKENIIDLTELKDKNIVKQNFDYSCGSAALATLLNYYLGENLTERQVIYGLMEYGNKKKINERRAFSLLDMKKFVNKLGYECAGYKAEMDDLLELGQPCIIPIEFLGYRHFTVLKGIFDEHIFLADPFRGNTSYTLSEFEDMWYENVIFMASPTEIEGLTSLQLTDNDLLYISEDSIDDLLTDYAPEIIPSDKRDFEFTLPNEYNKYKH